MLPTILPNSVEAERSLIGSILIAGERFYEVDTILQESDFYNQINAIIFGVMRKIARSGVKIDLLSVRQGLVDSGNLENVGGNQYLISLTNDLFSSDVIHSAKIIRRKAMNRSLIQIGNEITVSGYDEESDINSLVTMAEEKISKVPTGRSDTVVTMDKFYEEYQERMEHIKNGNRLGYTTGVKLLDTHCEGLQPGTVTRLVAYTNTGKTRVAIWILCNLLRQGIRCSFFSTEVVSAQFFPILASSYLGENFRDIKYGRADLDWYALGKLPLHFYEDKRKLNEIISCAKFHKSQVVFVDYVQNIKALDKGSRMEHLEEYSQRIQQFAIDNKVAVFDLSQMNNEGAKLEGKSVIISAKGSGDLVQTADVAIEMTRKVFDTNNTLLEFNVKKNKYGPLVSCELAADFSRSQFAETPCISN